MTERVLDSPQRLHGQDSWRPLNSGYQRLYVARDFGRQSVLGNFQIMPDLFSGEDSRPFAIHAPRDIIDSEEREKSSLA